MKKIVLFLSLFLSIFSFSAFAATKEIAPDGKDYKYYCKVKLNGDIYKAYSDTQFTLVEGNWIQADTTNWVLYNGSDKFINSGANYGKLSLGYSEIIYTNHPMLGEGGTITPPLLNLTDQMKGLYQVLLTALKTLLPVCLGGLLMVLCPSLIRRLLFFLR